MLIDSRKARDEGDWTRARQYYQTAWDSGFKTVEVAIGFGEAQLAGFAFAATEHEKERAEYYMLEGIKLDKRSPVPYKALGELYGEWDRYEEAVKMYGKYLQLSPKAGDRKRIERQIQKFNLKARR
jgi:tetratricopeptide (TPR) repeat protein